MTFGPGRRRVPLEDGGVRVVDAEDAAHLPVATALTDGIDPGRWLAEHGRAALALLDHHGGLLLRGFAGDERGLGAAVERASGPLFAYTYRSTPRTTVEGLVYTSTEYPPSQAIALHNEMSYAAAWPSRLWFLCLRPATTGGETTIADGAVVHARLPADLRARFERHGVEYRRRYGPHLDLSWQVAFQADDRAEVDAACRRQGLHHEWLPDGELVTRGVRPATLVHPRSGAPIWFNQAHLFHPSTLGAEARRALVETLGPDRLPRDARFGDGTPIPDADVAAIHDAYAGATRAVAWQAGDLVLLDNERLAHGRRPFTGPRRVVVAMSQATAEVR